MTRSVAVLGGGSWGTTLAHLIARNGHPVKLWLRDAATVQAITTTGRNPRYLPELELHPGLEATTSLAEAAAHAQVILLVVPSYAVREVMAELSPGLDGSHVLIHGIKGIEPGTFKGMSQILREESCCRKIGVLSGPNLAKEVAADYPSAAVLASRFPEVIEVGTSLLKCRSFRVYGSDDVVGTELGGSLKNVVAIASGMAHGLGFGDNTMALLLTRGLTEIARLGAHMQANPLTFSGLSGIGDLMATCFSPLSRNYQVGFRVARGESLAAVTADLRQVAEGVRTTRTVAEYAQAHGIYMPITMGVHQVLFEDVSPRDALQALLASGRNPTEQDRPQREISIL